MAPVGPFHAAFRLGLMAAKGAQAPEAAAVTSIKAPSTGSHQQLPMQGAAAASLTLPQGPAPALLTLVREVQEEELDGGGRTDGSIASSVASSSAFSAVAEALALSVEGDGDEAAAAAAVESGEGWGFFSPMEWEGEEEVSVYGEEKEEEEEEDQVCDACVHVYISSQTIQPLPTSIMH